MKSGKFISPAIPCAALALVAVVCLISCGKQEGAGAPLAGHHSLNITVDPRMELLSVVEILSGYGQRTNLITRYNLSYKTEVERVFAPFKDHPAVASFRKLSQSPYSFRYSTPPNTMLRLSDPPELLERSKIPRVIYSLSGGRARLEDFLDRLRDFARVTNFMDFYDAHRNFYAGIVAGAYGQLDSVDVVTSLEDYLGMYKQSYNIIIVPLQSGSFGIETDDDQLYNICGPDSLKADTPYVRGVRDICWHEFGHSFVNPVAAKHISQLRKDAPLFDPIAARMHCGGYDDLKSYIFEHVLRAVNVRMVSLYLGKAEAEKSIEGHESVGFVYVRPLAERLKQYEAHRDKYPTFADFFPELVDEFDELAQSHLPDSFYAVPFTGTIRSVVSDYKDLFIVPTHEADRAAQKAICDHITALRDRYYKGSRILTDEAALKENLSGHSLLVFGTVAGNLWLSRYRDSLPFRIDADKVTVGGDEYYGNHLKLLVAWRSPFSDTKGICIYTAQGAADIPGMFSLPDNWADYIVANDKSVLKWASFGRHPSIPAIE